MLLPVLSRVIAKLVATRLQTWAESQGLLHDFQWGFRPNRRCTDLALILTLVIEMANVHCKSKDSQWDSVVIVLWDIIKAYPSTQRHLAWKLFHRLGVPESLLRILSGLHDHTQYVIRAGKEFSDPFDLAIGFREGCPSSPACFSIFHNFAIGRFLQCQQTAANPGLHCTVNPEAPFHLRRKLAGNKDVLDSLDLLAVLFADDTTGLTRLSQLSQFDHPGKTHRLTRGGSPPLGNSFDEAVKFLGMWLHYDGKHDRDTHETMGKVVSAIAEAWAHSSDQRHAHQLYGGELLALWL